MSKNSFYLTTTLPYVNAPLHMGHALEFVRADAVARYKKLLGFDVYFNTGTDEHGIKIYGRAKEEGLSVQEFVDRGFEIFKEQIKMFGVSDDAHFIRTTEERHEKAAQEFWKRVAENGYIYKKNYEAKYCIGCESEKTDSELVDGECPEHPGKKLEIIEEENYFFKYSAFGGKILDFYEQNPNFVIPEFRFNEMKAFVKNGLQDFSISRLKSKMPWGIPVPDDPDHVMYVWFDALVNYISTLGWPASPLLVEEGVRGGGFKDSPPRLSGTPPSKGGENLFEKYWVRGNPTQYCGKDNTRFQSVMWQAMLMAAGLPNSHQIVVNGFITGEGGVRMSKTLGNVVDPRDIVRDYGIDALRYFLLREVGSFEDSPFTLERFKNAYNSGLANGLGNLASRILTLSEKYDVSLKNRQPFLLNQVGKWMEIFDIKQAMDEIWWHISDIDKFIADKKPFSLFKTNPEKAKSDVLNSLYRLQDIAATLKPFLPETSGKIIELIEQNKKPIEPLFPRKN